jgi:hypothetical protein
MEVIEKKDPYASQKKYYQKHKAEINEYNKARYHANREEIIPIRRQKFDCELCGGRYTYDYRGQHFGSKMHRNALAKATEEISSLALRIVDVQGTDKGTMERQMTMITELASKVKKTTPRNPKYIDFSDAFSTEA